MRRALLMTAAFLAYATLGGAALAEGEAPPPTAPSATPAAPSAAPAEPSAAPAEPAAIEVAPEATDEATTPEAAPDDAAEPAAPAEPAVLPVDAGPRPQGPPRHDLVRVNAGFRFSDVPSSGFDTFATSDTLTQFSVDATMPLITEGRLVVALGLGWDVGGREDGARGQATSLAVHRLYVPVEGRYHLLPGLYAFGKVAPGAAAMIATVKLSDVPAPLSTTAWAVAGDASVGASILLGPQKDMDRRVARFWVTPELGWSLTTSAPLRLTSDRDEADVLGSDEELRLRPLALGGFFWRATVGVTF